MTVTGKIRKVEMRETAIEELGLQEVAKIRTSQFFLGTCAHVRVEKEKQ